MSATVHRIHPDGPAIAEMRGRPMRMLAEKLGFVSIAKKMQLDASKDLQRLDVVVAALSAMVHGYAIAFERHGHHSSPDRTCIEELRTEIANYMQSRVNELG